MFMAQKSKVCKKHVRKTHYLGPKLRKLVEIVLVKTKYLEPKSWFKHVEENSALSVQNFKFFQPFQEKKLEHGKRPHHFGDIQSLKMEKGPTILGRFQSSKFKKGLK